MLPRGAKFLLAQLTLMLLLAAPSPAGFAPAVSNLAVEGGLTPGYTTTGTNGTIRWNPAVNLLEYNFSGTWIPIGSGGGSGGGSGNGFPLTSSVSAAGFNLTNGGTFSASSGVFSVLGAGPLDGAALLYSPTGYLHRFVPHGITNRLDLLFSYGTTNLGVLYPGQLLFDNMVAGPNLASGTVYILTQTLYPTNFLPYTTNAFPWPESVAGVWDVFSLSGRGGGTGDPGPPGADGIGNLRYGVWAATNNYVFDPTNRWVVSRQGRWYDLIADASGGAQDPATYTNSWSVSVDRGASGTVLGTNYVSRGEWDVYFVGYASNDVVSYAGNWFVKNTNDLGDGALTAPLLDADSVGYSGPYWDIAVKRGLRGVQGIRGADGDVVNAYSYYYWYTNIFLTNVVVTTTSGVTRIAAFGVTNDQSSAIYFFTGTNSEHTVDVARASFLTFNTNQAASADLSQYPTGAEATNIANRVAGSVVGESNLISAATASNIAGSVIGESNLVSAATVSNLIAGISNQIAGAAASGITNFHNNIVPRFATYLPAIDTNGWYRWTDSGVTNADPSRYIDEYRNNGAITFQFGHMTNLQRIYYGVPYTAPSTFTVFRTAAYRLATGLGTGARPFGFVGFANSTNRNNHCFEVYEPIGPSGYAFNKNNGNGTPHSSYEGQSSEASRGESYWQWVRCVDDGTLRYFQGSSDGVHWINTCNPVARADFMDPDVFIFGVYTRPVMTGLTTNRVHQVTFWTAHKE